MKKYLFLISILIFLIIGLVMGYYIFSPKQTGPKIDSLIIYNKLQNQGFLVTQDYVSEQKVTIDNTTGTWWKDLFWGQKITASSVLKVSLGVDLQKLQPQDITSDNKITINLPPIEVQSVEVLWDIILQNSQGVLKRLLNNNDGYNQALAQLKDQAKAAALSPDITSQTQAATITEITKLVRLIVGDKDVAVNFRK
ncbi:MAG: DUF4230 domain-containing protein [Patescibacteria group bacterium]